MKITNCILLFLIFLSASCNKNENIHNGVTGTVLDKTTNTPVADAEVGLFEKDAEIFGGLGGVLLETKYAESDGSFHFDFTERSGYNYYVHAIKEQYFNDQSNNITYIHNGDDDVIVYLQPQGYLNIHFKNVLPSSPSDQFGINGYVTDNFVGNDLDTNVIYTVYSNMLIELHWAVGYDETISDTIYCPSFDTTYFEILY
ncbi:MAG: hypothetical protein H7Y00_13735 [Fimbriimonadaceae bacterium]|nr:hypothetical protein [Chitinophagales bacterium]